MHCCEYNVGANTKVAKCADLDSSSSFSVCVVLHSENEKVKQKFAQKHSCRASHASLGTLISVTHF